MFILKIISVFRVRPKSILTAFFLGLYLSCASSQLHANDFHFIFNKQLTLRSNFQLEVLTLALEATQKAYGDYSVNTMESGYTLSRRMKIAKESPEIIIWASPYNPINKGLAIIEYPIFGGVLGLRSIIVHKDKLNDLAQIKTLSELNKYTVGQGPGWIDVSIYKHNGFNVVEARMTELFKMIANKRFDIFPLGKIEIDNAVLNSKEGGKDLIIAPNHMIYYPLPVLFRLDEKHKNAIKRLNDGMKKITKDGSLAALFERHYSDVTKQIQQQDMTVFELENNTLPTSYLERMKNTPILKHIVHTNK